MDIQEFADNQYAFTLTPMSQDIELEAGQTYTGYITVTNPVDSTADFSFKASISPYSVMGEDYVIDLTTKHDRSLITEWITINEPTGTLKPNESRQIEFTINVPTDAPAGGQYATIAVTADNPSSGEDNMTVQNVLEIASIIYAKVAGETVHQGQILENNVPSFVTSSPVVLGAMFENTGNVHDYATFSISVTDFFTGQVILPTAENTGRYSEIIMPGTTYYSQREISDLPAVGVVKVSQTIYYNGEVSVQESNVVICPVWFMVLILFTIIAFIITITTIVKKHRRRKKELSAT